MNAKRVVGLFVLIAGLALCGKGFRLIFVPPWYKATVKMEVEPDYPPGEYTPYDPYFMETELKIMEGGTVLNNVVQALNLDVKWGKQHGQQVGTSDAIRRLKQNITLDVLPNTKLIDITFWDRDPTEAAQIANAIAETYSSYRTEQHRQQMEAGIEKLEEDYQAEETNLFLMQSNVDQLQVQFDPVPPDEDSALSSLVSPKEMNGINKLLIQEEEDYAKKENQWIEFQAMRATNSKALREVLPTIINDPALSDLLRKYNESEQAFVTETNSMPARNSDPTNMQALVESLNKQIDSRVELLVHALEIRAEAEKFNLDSRKKMTEEARVRFATQQPYWEAKQKLEAREKLHEVLKQKIQESKADALIPRTTLVTVVESAVPPNVTATANRWQGGVSSICGLALAVLGIGLHRTGQNDDDQKCRISPNS
jgi:uncharacterized protein involved in exopolysaccharide biosynthesis